MRSLDCFSLIKVQIGYYIPQYDLPFPWKEGLELEFQIHRTRHPSSASSAPVTTNIQCSQYLPCEVLTRAQFKYHVKQHEN
jgi:hypothetical protein